MFITKIRLMVLSVLLIFGHPVAVTLVAQDANQSERDVQSKTKKIDQTGINWLMPFSAVLDKAKTEKRIVAIKMIAFGTNSTGCW